ncbi:MAG: trypsin-like serine peptidase [Alphaproteobacteria bacterium]
MRIFPRPGTLALGGSLLAAVAMGGAGLALFPESAEAQSNTCQYRYDGECDESYGTGLCAEGTDSWDCRRAGPPPGPESCIYSNDGECDEPAGTGLCIPFTDTVDCRREGIDQSRVFFGHDDRIWPDSRQAPWSMIGRITYASGGHCTGTLVGPSTVLTAAHCMFGGDGPGGTDMALEFIAGASGPHYVDRARVISTYVPPQFDPILHDNSSDVDGYDWAFLTLDRPIGNTVGWMAIEPLTTAALEQGVASRQLYVMQGGYSADGMAFLSANLRCPVVEVWDDNTIFHECDTLQGDSGSPLFLADSSGYRILAVESATYPNDEGRYDFNMAVDARAFWPVSHKFTN